MTAPTADERATWRALAEAATEGPWHPATTGVENGDHWSVIDYPTMNPVAHVPSNDGGNEDQRRPDAEFIAAAREGWPRTMDALDKAEGDRHKAEEYARVVGSEVQRLREGIEALTEQADAVVVLPTMDDWARGWRASHREFAGRLRALLGGPTDGE